LDNEQLTCRHSLDAVSSTVTSTLTAAAATAAAAAVAAAVAGEAAKDLGRADIVGWARPRNI
jgi:hypothetical protein